MESKALTAILTVSLLFSVYSWGLYKVGRILERKDLTQYFSEQVNVAYYEGKEDGVKEGFKSGERLGLSTCNDILQNGEDGGHR